MKQVYYPRNAIYLFTSLMVITTGLVIFLESFYVCPTMIDNVLTFLFFLFLFGIPVALAFRIIAPVESLQVRSLFGRKEYSVSSIEQVSISSSNRKEKTVKFLFSDKHGLTISSLYWSNEAYTATESWVKQHCADRMKIL